MCFGTLIKNPFVYSELKHACCKSKLEKYSHFVMYVMLKDDLKSGKKINFEMITYFQIAELLSEFVLKAELLSELS